MGNQAHAYHRERTLARFKEFGLKTFNDHQALEMLLFFSIPRKDTNLTAHYLIDRFGSLNGVLEASIEQLTEIKGIGEYSALLLHLVCEMIRRYECGQLQTRRNGNQLNSALRISQYFIPQFIGESEETLLVAFVDASGYVISCEEMNRGSISTVSVCYDRIIRRIFLLNATGIVMAHNHPGGQLTPSRADIEVTIRLENMLEVCGKDFLDHCIVANGKTCSIFNCREYRLAGGKHGRRI